MIYIETYYLIDYENVHGNGLSGCQDLGKNDHIVIFFTQNARNIDMNDISNHGDAELEMIEVPTGKQSADMHIGSYLGYLAGKSGKNCNVVIVSKDTDFDKVIKFWKENGIFEKSVEQNEGNEEFTFYDGPPTANGKPNIGHILTRVIKDIIPRYQTMKGKHVLRKAGWDTHGLPVEL